MNVIVIRILVHPYIIRRGGMIFKQALYVYNNYEVNEDLSMHCVPPRYIQNSNTYVLPYVT